MILLFGVSALSTCYSDNLFTAAKPSDVSENSEAPGSQRRNSSDAISGDFVDPKVRAALSVN